MTRWLLTSLVGIAAASAWSAEPIAPDQFRAIQSIVKPQAGEEKWGEIPWLSSLWDARKQAAAEGKPILLWEMDGHPLGCV